MPPRTAHGLVLLFLMKKSAQHTVVRSEDDGLLSQSMRFIVGQFIQLNRKNSRMRKMSSGTCSDIDLLDKQRRE
jgi:hypothetical protein